jgi:hypothetical protein
MPRVWFPTFFCAGEYPADGRSERCFSAPSRKRFVLLISLCNAGDTGEGGARRAIATSLLMMAVKGASGDSAEGIFLVMMAIFGVAVFFGVRRRSFAAKNKEESKIVNLS